jgi:hypothetical protein
MFRAAVAISTKPLLCRGQSAVRSINFVPFFVSSDANAEPPVPPRTLTLAVSPGRVMSDSELLPCPHVLEAYLPPGVDANAVPNLHFIKLILHRLYRPQDKRESAEEFAERRASARAEFVKGIDQFKPAIAEDAAERFVARYLERPDMDNVTGHARLGDLVKLTRLELYVEQRGYVPESGLPVDPPTALVPVPVMRFPEEDGGFELSPRIPGVVLRGSKRLSMCLGSMIGVCQRQQLPLVSYGDRPYHELVPVLNMLSPRNLGDFGLDPATFSVTDVTKADGFAHVFGDPSDGPQPTLPEAVEELRTRDPDGAAAAFVKEHGVKPIDLEWAARAVSVVAQHVLPTSRGW